MATKTVEESSTPLPTYLAFLIFPMKFTCIPHNILLQWVSKYVSLSEFCSSQLFNPEEEIVNSPILGKWLVR